MPELISTFMPAYVLGFVASCLLETGLRPRPAAPWRRPPAALGVHAGIWTMAFALTLALFQRPVFAAASAWALQTVLVMVNNAKYLSLREPFVYPDFVFFTDALKHPRLYLPFLGWRLPFAAALGYGVALWAGFTLETVAAPPSVLLMHAATLALLGWLGARYGARHLPVSRQFDATQDVQQLGLLAALWQYAVAERVDTQAMRAAAPFAAQMRTQAAPAMPLCSPRAPALPNLLVIQSESFFDPRRVYPQIRPDVLAHYDTLCAQALQHGALHVDAWGANTIRTEFSFLSGIAPDTLGVHRFHPYRRLARQGVATLASYLRSRGYRTLCVHPYHGSFYGRDQVLPQLGFDDFIDLRAFGAARRAGPYVGDLALADTVQALLQQHDQDDKPPLYLHVITMENHGPLHWERVSDADAHAVLSTPLPPGCDELVAYLRHLRNADAMFGQLRQYLLARARSKTTALCLFGDHVPIMPSLYRQWGEPDASTNYLIWRPDAQPALAQPSTPVCVHQLAQICLRQTGITSSI